MGILKNNNLLHSKNPIKKEEIKCINPNRYILNRYETKIADNGNNECVLVSSEELSLPQFVAYKTKKSLSGKKLKFLAGASAGLIAMSILFSGCGTREIENSKKYKTEFISSIENVSPNSLIETYDKNDETYLTVNSALNIAKYNCEQVKQQLLDYEKRTGKKAFKYNIEEDFDYIVAGIMLAESSLRPSIIAQDKAGTYYYGAFMINQIAADDANLAHEKLCKEELVKSTDDLLNPVIAGETCVDIFLKNASYLDYYKIDVNMENLLWTYEHGIKNVLADIDKGLTAKDHIYPSRVIDYAKALKEYKKSVIDCKNENEKADALNRLNKKLNEIYDNYNSNNNDNENQSNIER